MRKSRYVIELLLYIIMYTSAVLGAALAAYIGRAHREFSLIYAIITLATALHLFVRLATSRSDKAFREVKGKTAKLVEKYVVPARDEAEKLEEEAEEKTAELVKKYVVPAQKEAEKLEQKN